MTMAAIAVTFQRENVKTVWPELMPLMRAHWAEIIGKGVFDPDLNFYIAADEAGILRVYTAREAGALVGYCVFIVCNHPHSKTLKQAQQDGLFLKKENRGHAGPALICWCEEQLRAEGVAEVRHASNAGHDLASLFERSGYALTEKIYSKRLA